MTDKPEAKDKTVRGTHYWEYPEKFTIIGLDTKDGPEHPLYDPRIHSAISPQEVANVDYYGVKKPVVARKNDGRLETIDGRGRIRRARLANELRAARGDELMRVPYLLEKGQDAELFALSRTLNLHKADGPMTTAQNVQRMLAMGKTVGEVALTFGVSEQTVRNYQSMLDLDPAVIEAMVKEEISGTAAIQLATLPKAEQKAVLVDVQTEQKATGKKATVENVKARVAERQGKATNTPKDKIKRATNVLLKYAAKSAGDKTKEEMANTLERVCKLLTGAGLDKLAATDEE